MLPHLSPFIVYCEATGSPLALLWTLNLQRFHGALAKSLPTEFWGCLFLWTGSDHNNHS